MYSTKSALPRCAREYDADGPGAELTYAPRDENCAEAAKFVAVLHIPSLHHSGRHFICRIIYIRYTAVHGIDGFFRCYTEIVVADSVVMSAATQVKRDLDAIDKSAQAEPGARKGAATPSPSFQQGRESKRISQYHSACLCICFARSGCLS